MTQALRRLGVTPDVLVLDYVRLPHVPIPQYVRPHADALHLCVAAASIIAKVTRDHLMGLLAQRYPGYGFAVHKGYGTPDHRRSLAGRGITPIHRRSFAPVRMLAAQPGFAQLDEFDNREDTC
jgi:ribonuclease HII